MFVLEKLISKNTFYFLLSKFSANCKASIEIGDSTGIQYHKRVTTTY